MIGPKESTALLLKLLGIVLCIVLGLCLISHSTTLEWDKNTETDLKGYKVYYEGNDSSDVKDVGLNNFLLLDFLVLGVEYLFNITAYDTSLNESGFSKDLRYTEPTTTTSIVTTISSTSSSTTSVQLTTSTSSTSIQPTTTSTTITIVTTTSIQPTTTSISSTTTTIDEEWTPCLGDINRDGFVDDLDEELLYEEFGRTNCRRRGLRRCKGDLDRDRDVDEDDALILVGEFGRDDCNDQSVLLYLIRKFFENLFDLQEVYNE